MLIDFRKLFQKWNINPKGVLHVGANVGEEAPVYDELGIKNVIWIEGNPELMSQLIKNINKYGDQFAFNFLASDENNEKAILHVSNNAGQSSSILELGTHKDAHPDVHYTHDVEVPMYRIEDANKRGILTLYHYDNHNDLLDNLDFLNIDVQGAELKVLRGMGDLLDQFKWIYLEVNKRELYKGCALIDEIDLFLLGKGFRRIETRMLEHWGWGDACYSKI